MAVNNIIKRIRNIMRQDAGINGDAQRIEQMTWMIKKHGNTKHPERVKHINLLFPKICVGVIGR